MYWSNILPVSLVNGSLSRILSSMSSRMMPFAFTDKTFKSHANGWLHFPLISLYCVLQLQPISFILRKHNYSNILEILPPENENFQIKKFWYFSYFCSKHRLWILVRTASSRQGGSNEYPQATFMSRDKKKMYAHVNPSCTI